MNVLLVASECSPFVKTGGLADVIGALPKALNNLGQDVKVLLPAYPALSALTEKGKTELKFASLHGAPARLVSVSSDGLNLLLLDAPHLYGRAGNIYLDANGMDWQDNYLRFGALSEVAAVVAKDGLKDWSVDLVSVHDWQAGLVPAYLRQSGEKVPPCVVTIYNIAFQGVFEPTCLDDLKLDKSLFTPEGLEYYGKVSFLKAGIAFSDKITTVSPTYAGEILQSEFGMGLEGLLQARKDDLVGILNGIDLDSWDPSTDTRLFAAYSISSMKGKAANRAALIERFGLNPVKNAPLFCVVSRLSAQKGLDLLLQVIPTLVGRGAKLAILGAGDKDLEKGFLEIASRYPGSVGVVLGYDESLAHQLQGGSDAILIPSRFEPCGLTQLYAMRYGTIPVVARTGGLADTVIDANDAALAAQCATGIQFVSDSALALDMAIARTCELFSQPTIWKKMIRNGMAQASGWDKSAARYDQLFRALVAANSKRIDQ